MTSIRSMKGIGDKTEQLFAKLGIFTVEDLLHYYPRDYEIYEPAVPIERLGQTGIFAVEGILIKRPEVKAVRNLKVVTASVKDDTGILALTWYNMGFLQKSLRPGSRLVFRGRLVYKNGRMVMEQPKMYTLAAYDMLLHVMQPVYGLTGGLSNQMVIKAVRQALEGLKNMDYQEYLPAYLRQGCQLAEYSFAIENVHFPENMESYKIARRRLVFEEFFIFILALKRLKEANDVTKNKYPMDPVEDTEALIRKLPYSLTNAQKRVWLQIKEDLRGEKAMNRLVQGDVGSGKTIIAVLALMEAACHGFQGAFMVPTEVLARQHYDMMTDLFEGHGIKIRVTLLTGSMTAKEKKTAYEAIETHETDIIVGTHALIQEKVVYNRLALVITDEQHRFGVNQRETLSKKAEGQEGVHVLVMSATPIPRTLAIILYGDLDISIIDELPANRRPIKNCVVDTGSRPKAYHFIEQQVAAGRQAYVICPMVEESEQMEAENVMDYTERLRAELSAGISIVPLHGKMKPKEKNDIMEAFARNKIQVLVSTTVVEVGVNVPNATVMMVENAERFGLAQLHQLRGRVGRGKEQSYCILVSSSGKKETMERLEILNQSNDGFFIAEEDLKLRGPGDLLGIRQSGTMEFKIGDVYADASVLAEAAQAAQEVLLKDKNLECGEHEALRRYLDTYLEKNVSCLNL